MDDKYQISKSKEPETKQEIIQHRIEELIKKRDKETSPTAKKTINAEIMKLFAQYERLKL
jgi:ubiquinone biosynthesis protein COQ9